MTIEETIAAAVEAKLRPVMDELRAIRSEMRPTAEDGYLSIEKAAALAEVHADTLRGWIKDGRLPEHRAGRELRVRRSELHRFMERGGSKATQVSPEETAAVILSLGRK